MKRCRLNLGVVNERPGDGRLASCISLAKAELTWRVLFSRDQMRLEYNRI